MSTVLDRCKTSLTAGSLVLESNSSITAIRWLTCSGERTRESEEVLIVRGSDGSEAIDLGSGVWV